MKHLFRILPAVLVTVVCWGCVVSSSESFSYTDCHETKAGEEGSYPPAHTLTLSSSGHDLVITETGACFCCDYEALDVETKVSGKEIWVTIRPTNPQYGMVNCICYLDRVRCAVSGLQFGEEYTLHYQCDGKLAPIVFPFSSGLNLEFDQDRLEELQTY